MASRPKLVFRTMSEAASSVEVLSGCSRCACRSQHFRPLRAVELLVYQKRDPQKHKIVLPSDFPLSIKELALLPLWPKLLLLEPFSTPFLISLFRRIIGVSANGNETLIGSKDVSTGCVRFGSVADVVDGAGAA